MLANIISFAKDFVMENAVTVGFVMAGVEYLKVWLRSQAWYQGPVITASAFLLAFLFVIPEAGFVGIDWLEFAISGIAVGGAATGIFKLGSSLAEKA
jgi:hypothetical protein